MSTLHSQARFVRHQDTGLWGLRDPMRVNRRNGYVETRAGLSWTGVRPYQTPSGLLRVLRRRGQVESPGHVRTLRRLPAPEGHPSGDRDVTPANSDELVRGFTGDRIDIEMIEGFARPVADLTVIKPATFCKMYSPEAWAAYQREYPEYSAGIERPPGPARTGTSLGYNALWLGPTVEAEIVDDRDGALVGSWLGPDGNQHPYDAEHVVDPDCEIVQRLVRDDGFDPDTLGGQHFAIALEALTGRGEAQAELMRIVDSKLVGADPTRARVQFAVPRATRVTDMQWVVGAARDLPLEDGDRTWDGDAAAASIFEASGWPDSPDPVKARRGFLIHDADAPELKGSYKLPFARVDEDGALRVPKSGRDAAAQFLPKTDAPSEVLDRAQAVLDLYKEKFDRAQPGRDARTNPVTKQAIVINVRDSAAAYMTKKGIAIPTELRMTLDEVDARVLLPKIEEIMGRMAELAEMLKMAEGENDKMSGELVAMQEKTADMPTVEAAQAKVAEVEAAMATAKEELAAALTAAAEAKKTGDAAIASVQASVEKLEAEVAPIRAQQLVDFREQAVKFGLDKAIAEGCKDDASLKRAFVSHAVAPVADDVTAEIVNERFTGVWAGLATKTTDAEADAAKKLADAKTPPAKYEPGVGLRAVPNPTIRDTGKPPADAPAAPQTTADEIGAALL